MNLKLKKILSGMFWLVFFLGVIYAAIYYSKPKPTAEDKIKPSIKIKQEIVQEESITIDVVKKVSPSVVSIVVKSVAFDFFSGPTSMEQGIGTGFIVDPNGLIVTNSHVVDSVDGSYSVVLSDGKTFPVERINLDTATDLAILEITSRGLPGVELGDSSNLQVGQTAIAIGNALGRYSNTVTVGVVSGVSRGLSATGAFGESKTYENAIQTDAALNPGNSGGPLLNSKGQVIGINVATTIGADNIGFAIPVNTLKPILESFLKNGKIVKPFLGVSYTIISEEISKLRNLPEGAFVSRVVPGSPAETAEIRRGDIITSFDGKKIDSTYTLGTAVSSKKPGDVVKILIDRLGAKLDLQITLTQAPDLGR